MDINDIWKPSKRQIEFMTETNTVTNTDKKLIGRIVKLSEDGWGFITSKDQKFTRIFFHWSSLTQDTLKFTELKVGMEVEFYSQKVEPTEDRPKQKGYRAIKINVINKGV
jgi:cold shock CspA family protein